MLGLLLILVCAGGFALFAMHSGDKVSVLALARAVSVGHLLTAADLREVEVAAGPGVELVAADQAAVVVGKPASTNLSAGSLLTPTAVGEASSPARGQAIVALALKAGQIPAGIGSGSRVALSSTPAEADRRAARAVWFATVTDLATQPHDQTTVVSVQLGEGDAIRMALLAPEGVSLVLLSAGGGR